MTTMNEYGTSRLQVRCEFDAQRIHIQGVGQPQVNRKYGLAMELRAPTDLTDWLREQEPTHVSPASGTLLYIKAEMHYFPDTDTTQLVLHGTDTLNHPSGAVLDIDQDVNNEATQALMQFAKSAGLVTISVAEPFTGEEE